MNSLSKRIFLLNSTLAVFFAGIVLRLFWLQIWQAKHYEVRASNQQTISGVLEARRGDILAHEKDATLTVATTKGGWLLAINPKILKDSEKMYELLSAHGIDISSKESFLEKASRKNDPYEIIAHRVPHETKTVLDAIPHDGLVFSQENWRFYPVGNFLSGVLGFVDRDGVGKYGLERFYDKDLIGRDGVFHGETTSGGNSLLFGGGGESGEDGSTIVLGIDTHVQAYLEKIVNDVLHTYRAQNAGGIVINPKTGKIIAMAATPAFDPNEYSKTKDISLFQNPHTEDLFEMGSVVKPLTMAAALDAGAVTPETTYVDTGTVTLNGKTISNFDGKARGRIPMQEILSQSLNVGATFLMEQLGRDRFRTYMHNYGLGEPTGIDLPNEVHGNLKNLESTRDIEYATAAFGQGISMTPIEFVRALSSLANGGFLVNPYLVEEIHRPNGDVVTRKAPEPKRILKEETSQTVTRMLVEVVDKKLANGHGQIPGYSVAAKTGTAQIASATSRGYSGDFLHTFFGYGPAYDPQFLVFFFLNKPKGIQYASESLTEPFRATMQYLFSYFEVPPDRAHDVSH